MIDKGFLQSRISDLLNKIRSSEAFNKQTRESYEKTILRYKSILHHMSEDEMDDFCHKIFEKEKYQKSLNKWSDFQHGKEDAIHDIATILRQYLD